MGLLDDAIREHLELKRRNGDDPGEIARKENEALAPVFSDAQDREVGSEATLDDDVVGQDEGAYSPDPDGGVASREPYAGAKEPEGDITGDGDGSEPQLDPEGQASSVEGEFEHGQETAELDMETMLDAEEPSVQGELGSAARPAPARPPAVREEDSFEWELSGETSDAGPPQEIPGQERLTFE